MLQVACSTEYFPLTLTLSRGERIPRVLCAHCAPEPTPCPSAEGSNTGRPVPLLGGVRGTAVELGTVRARRSADFSPPPAVSPGRQGSGLKSALLNSMGVGVRGGLVGARFIGREKQASDWCLTDRRWANSGAGVIEQFVAIRVHSWLTPLAVRG